MKTSTTFSLPIALLVSINSLYGQEPKAAEVAVVGCIARAVTDGSLSGAPGVPPASPNSAPTLANSSEPTGAFLLNNAVMARGTQGATTAEDSQETRSFQLDGSSAAIEPHLGHHVQVTGRLITLKVGASPSEKTPVEHIQVSAIRMLADKCEPKVGERR